MNIEIANKLLQLRKEKGLSQEQLAQKLGISRQAISKWERAEASPDTDNLIELAKLYDISLDELLLHEPTSKEKAPENEDKDEEYVHVGFDGVHVKEHKGDEVHVSWDGVHVAEKDGHRVDVDKNGIYVDGEKYQKEDFMHWHEENKKYSFPFGAILLFGFLIYAVWSGNWHPTWIILLAIPTFDSLITAINKRKFSKFAYPLLCVMVYLWIGFYNDYWHPGWIVFLTIPCYYIIADYIDHKKTS